MSPSSSSSSSSSTSMKLKTLIHKLITSSVYRFIKAISKAKSILLEVSRHNTKSRLILFYPKKVSKNQKKIFFGSFRLHYNWCSSHVVPVPVPYRDEDHDSSYELSGYLEWLEKKDTEDFKGEDINGGDDDEYDYIDFGDDDDGDNGGGGRDRTDDDIDHLADMFIATCHEKFILEKVESYRKFQEMLARGL